MSRANAADILCIGAQRAMTSWLHHAMSAHPDTWAFPNFEPITSTSKEAHYWDWNAHRGPNWYKVLMRPLNDDHQSLDFTPDYAFLSDEQIADCKAINPQAKVIYILRDPLARAVSAIRMHTLWASQHAAADALKVTFGDTFLTRCQNARLWDHGAYSANLRRWRRYFPDLLVVNFEDLTTTPTAALTRIFDHCGLAFASLSDEARARIDERVAKKIWVTPAYALDADCLHFLHGATWQDRVDAMAETGLQFHEGTALLERHA